MNIRKFWFINANNQKYELTSKNSSMFLYQPSGLGFEKKLSVSRLGNEADILENVAEFPLVVGELLLHKSNVIDKYATYSNFIQFIKIKPLKLYYQTPNQLEPFYIDCEIVVLEKSEVETDGVMHCPIQIQGLSFWKTGYERYLNIKESTMEGKTYPYEYPYTYGGNYTNVPLTINGTLDSGFVLEINNRVSNPVLSLAQKNIKYGEIKILGTYDKIYVNTNDKNQTIRLEYQGSVIANPTSKFDISGSGDYETPFPKLRVGDNTLTFGFSGTFNSAVNIRWQDIALTI